MPTVRGTPVGLQLNDGYRTLITFDLDPDISLWEKTVKPPGADGGDHIDTTTMHNNTVRTKAPRALIDFTDGTFTAAYNPRVYDQIMALINQNGLITVWEPDDTAVDFYGWLRLFDTSDHSEGEQPEASCTFVISNVHPSTGVETLPNYYASGSI